MELSYQRLIYLEWLTNYFKPFFFVSERLEKTGEHHPDFKIRIDTSNFKKHLLNAALEMGADVIVPQTSGEWDLLCGKIHKKCLQLLQKHWSENGGKSIYDSIHISGTISNS